MHILRSLAQKGRLRTLSSSLESRKFIFGEDTATKASMLGVLYLQPSYEVVPYNISWRGLLVLLILRIGNARALDWDKRVQTPTLFYSTTYTKPEQGGWVRKIIEKMRVAYFLAILLFSAQIAKAQSVDYSVTSVEEEKGLELTKVSSDNDYVVMPEVKRNNHSVNWWMGHVIQLSPNGKDIAYLSARNSTVNVYVKSISGVGSSLQRTNRQQVLDFSYSPDGKKLCFVESNGNDNRIFVTDANQGYVCRLITSGDNNYSPVFSADMKNFFFSHLEKKNSASIWCYTLSDNSLSNIAAGLSPCSIPGKDELLCVRNSGTGLGEIWRVDYAHGAEVCVMSDTKRSFASPSLSPDGKWILMVGSSSLNYKSGSGSSNYSQAKSTYYYNTDIYVCRTDGSHLTQLTYHAADDLSPAWSADGKYIYFISQRGSADGTANIWRMSFKIKD